MTKKAIFQIISVLLLTCICVSLVGCKNDSETSSDPKRVEKIVEEIAVDYGAYGAEAADRISALLEELSSADALAGKRMKTIMNMWMSSDLGKPISYDVLPPQRESIKDYRRITCEKGKYLAKQPQNFRNEPTSSQKTMNQTVKTMHRIALVFAMESCMKNA